MVRSKHCDVPAESSDRHQGWTEEAADGLSVVTNTGAGMFIALV